MGGGKGAKTLNHLGRKRQRIYLGVIVGHIGGLQMVKVKLENVDALDIEINSAVQAMRCCYSSNHLSDGGAKDKELLKKAVRMGHHTPLEFITLTFSIQDMTRATLQELARHRTQVLNVQSTRYTLKKMKGKVRNNLSQYFHTDLPKYDEYLGVIFNFIEEHDLWELPNDKLKLYLPESLYCNLYMKVNLRNYFNFFKLRASDKAHYLIQELAVATYNTLPEYIKELVDISLTKH